ncbi:MAG: AI-2E family transporter [Myxococcales bacterium]|nr:AI-2E family transporter [Myxococcales bacterium]
MAPPPPPSDRSPQALGASALRTLAFLVLVIAGLKAASSLVLPVLAAALVSLACLPFTRRLERWGAPKAVAIMLVMAVVTLALIAATGFVAASLRNFIASLSTYQVRIWDLILGMRSWLEARHMDLPDYIWAPAGGTSNGVMELASSAAQGLLSLFTNTFLVLFIVFFILFEAHTFGSKLKAAYGQNTGLDLISDQVYRYLNIKAAMSVLTGVLVGALDLALGIDFPFVWALVAFLFNFVPTVGSIIAAIPPIALALLEFGTGHAAMVTLGYLVVNLGISNVLEPRIMGERLGLSPLVVILSLVFWAWVWGPFGMILALPMTMVVKILLEASSDLRPIAILLGPPMREPKNAPESAVASLEVR